MEALQALLGQADAALQAEGVPQAAGELQAQVATAQASLTDLQTSLSAQLREGTAGRCCLLCCLWYYHIPQSLLGLIHNGLTCTPAQTMAVVHYMKTWWLSVSPSICNHLNR